MGEYVKSISGRAEARVDGRSQAVLHIYRRNPLWSLITTLGPNNGQAFDANGDIKFEVVDKAFREASDVGGGFDLHFDDLWASVRVR